MAHLACSTHARRVLVLEGPKVLHRSDGSRCKDASLRSTRKGTGGKVAPEQVLAWASREGE